VARRFPVLQWHSDTFDLPPGATLLATSDACASQAFAAGSSYGLQFHLEAPPDLAATWLEIDAYRESLTAALGPDGPRILLDGLRDAHSQLTTTAREVMSCWLETFVTRRRRRGDMPGHPGGMGKPMDKPMTGQDR
jgi:GMP synthase-like glutamine amidotransferase